MFDQLRRMRRLTSETLAETLRGIAREASESEIRDMWLERLRQTNGIVTEGWYAPPPGGVIVAAASPPHYERVNQPSFRPQAAWPSSQYFLGDESLLYAYASPVDRETGVIGDLGCSLYRGSNANLRSHLRSTWKVTMAIIEEVEVGKSFPDLYRRAMELIESEGMTNVVHSVHAGSASDIGHLIPWSDLPASRMERDVINGGSLQAVADLVSTKRRFINDTDEFVIGENVALTIEPRLRRGDLPMAGFHTVVVIEDGRKRPVLEFDPLFDLFDMDYLG
jgi:hypothetical protein